MPSKRKLHQPEYDYGVEPKMVRCLGPGCEAQFLSKDPRRLRYCKKCEGVLDGHLNYFPTFNDLGGRHKYHD
jgi:hypothetical protein